jgi:hypothetical protein
MGIFDNIPRTKGQVAKLLAKKPAPQPPPPDGDFFAGMDRDTYPGDDVMEALIRTNLKWTGFYLTPAPSQGHNLKWMGKRSFLRGIGWGLAPIYVGRQVESVKHADYRMTPETGKHDGEDAFRLAKSAGIEDGAIIYLDFENGAPLEDKQKSYYEAWAAKLRSRGYRPGLYCVASIAAGLVPVVPNAVVWVANFSRFPKQVYTPPFPQPDPALGEINASLWQLRGNTTIEYDDLEGRTKHTVVDLSSSFMLDPSDIF